MVEALLINAAVIAAVLLVLWQVAARIGDVSFIDAVWGAGMALLAAVSWWQLDEPGQRASLIAAMAVIWGLRLGLHLYIRWRASGEDPRYARMLGKAKEHGRYGRAALTVVFAPQAVLLYITCLPAQLGVLASDAPAPLGPLAWAGFVLWLVGMVFETVGDAQLTRFRSDPASKGKVLDSGLWRYTRHPNYFGDACVWWGIWLAAADAGQWPMNWVAIASLIGPVFLTFTLTKWSGKPLLEKGLARTRPGYSDYIARTSGFFPLPPSRKTGNDKTVVR
jgi:steroid 5-alpha reductase family enzyme